MLLDEVGAGIATYQLIHQLRGWIDDAARARRLPTELTAETLVAEMDLAARYLREPPEVEKLWHRLRQAKPEIPLSVVDLQPWREVQPTLATALDRDSAAKVVFTSTGGGGKSFLLASLYDEEDARVRVWVDGAATTDNIEQAVALGAWARQRDQRPIRVFIDGLEQVEKPAALLQDVARAIGDHPDARIFAAARETTWADCKGDFLAGVMFRLLHGRSIGFV
ncbi:MAG TPA: hypothetical protein VFG83_19160 [Kofleriaceae bacterium]|nr:hypothetical protein [Kofleriaceae bacterium]